MRWYWWLLIGLGVAGGAAGAWYVFAPRKKSADNPHADESPAQRIGGVSANDTR
jgi:hypothetical protein